MQLKPLISLYFLWFTGIHSGKPLRGFAHVGVGEQNEISKKNDCQLPANQKNEYDSTGFYYDQCMQFLDKQIVSDPEKNFYNMTLGYFNSNVNSRKYFLNSTTSTETEMNTILLDAKNDYANILETQIVSNKVKKTATKLLAIIQNISDTSRQYCFIKQAILTLENNILKDKSIHTTERQIILQAFSIARYCLYYWAERLAINAGPIGKFKLYRYQAICLATICTTFVVGYNGGSFTACTNSAIASAMLYEFTELY